MELTQIEIFLGCQVFNRLISWVVSVVCKEWGVFDRVLSEIVVGELH